MVNLPPARFICGPSKQRRIGIMQGSWEPEISVAVTTTIEIPVEEALADIGIKTRNVVIHTECDGEASWVKLLG